MHTLRGRNKSGDDAIDKAKINKTTKEITRGTPTKSERATHQELAVVVARRFIRSELDTLRSLPPNFSSRCLRGLANLCVRRPNLETFRDATSCI